MVWRKLAEVRGCVSSEAAFSLSVVVLRTNVSAALSHTAKSQQESVDAVFTVWGSCLPPSRHSGRVSGVSDTSPGHCSLPTLSATAVGEEF